MTADLHPLTGAYALNALPDDERAAFEDHLAQCGACRDEVAELRETAARLGSAVAAPAPAELKTSVLEQVQRSRQLPPDGAHVIPLRRRRWPASLTAVAAAAAVIAAVVLGAQVITLNRDLEQTQQQLSDLTGTQAAVIDVLTAPDARVVTSQRGDTAAAVVISRKTGKLAFVPQRMPAPAPGRTYQLWLITPRGAHSAGLLGEAAQPVVAKTVADTRQVGVTIEPVGGSPQPTTDPVMQLALP